MTIDMASIEVSYEAEGSNIGRVAPAQFSVCTEDSVVKILLLADFTRSTLRSVINCHFMLHAPFTY